MNISKYLSKQPSPFHLSVFRYRFIFYLLFRYFPNCIYTYLSIFQPNYPLIRYLSNYYTYLHTWIYFNPSIYHLVIIPSIFLSTSIFQSIQVPFRLRLYLCRYLPYVTNLIYLSVYLIIQIYSIYLAFRLSVNVF